MRFSFTSTVRNRGMAPALIVHLNVLSRDPSVYVDPEDWSSARTRYLTVPTGGIANLRWTLRAVNSGSFVVYVAVMSQDGSGPIAVSGQLRVHVAERRTLDPGGALPALRLACPPHWPPSWWAAASPLAGDAGSPSLSESRPSHDVYTADRFGRAGPSKLARSCRTRRGCARMPNARAP